MLAVAFTSLGALSIVIDRALFHTFLYTGETANVDELLVWRALKDTRTKLLLIEGKAVLKNILRYDKLEDVKILLSEHVGYLAEEGVLPCDAVLAGTWQVQKVTGSINELLLGSPFGARALLPKTTLELGSTKGLLAVVCNEFLADYADHTSSKTLKYAKIEGITKPSDIKKLLCEHMVYVSKFPWEMTPALLKYCKKQDRLFKAYYYIFKYNNSVEQASKAFKIPKEDLFYVLKYAPFVLGRKFLKPSPKPPTFSSC